jgi:hypothetical protein
LIPEEPDAPFNIKSDNGALKTDGRDTQQDDHAGEDPAGQH